MQRSTSLTRRPFLRNLLTLTCAATLVSGAYAQADWPSKTIKLVVPFPAGGPTDTVSRVVGQELSKRLGKPVVVENKPGASGSVATAQLQRAPADGYTLLMLATPNLLAPLLFSSVKYDVGADFSPVAMVYDLPIVIVVNPQKLPDVNDLQQLIAHAKAQPQPMPYTSSSVGSFGHLSMELLKQKAGFAMEHIPYNGSAPALMDTLSGEVPVMYSDLIAALPHIQSGRLRAIAVGSPQRVPMVPDVKTIAEQGIEGYEAVSWGGILAPKGIPTAVAERIAKEVAAILQQPAIQERLQATGSIAHFEAPKEMQERIQRETTQWRKVVQDNHIAKE